MTHEALEATISVPEPANDGSIAHMLKAAGYYAGVEAGLLAAKEALGIEFTDPVVRGRIYEILDLGNVEYVRSQT